MLHQSETRVLQFLYVMLHHPNFLYVMQKKHHEFPDGNCHDWGLHFKGNPWSQPPWPHRKSLSSPMGPGPTRPPGPWSWYLLASSLLLVPPKKDKESHPQNFCILKRWEGLKKTCKNPCQFPETCWFSRWFKHVKKPLWNGDLWPMFNKCYSHLRSERRPRRPMRSYAFHLKYRESRHEIQPWEPVTTNQVPGLVN